MQPTPADTISSPGLRLSEIFKLRSRLSILGLLRVFSLLGLHGVFTLPGLLRVFSLLGLLGSFSLPSRDRTLCLHTLFYLHGLNDFQLRGARLPDLSNQVTHKVARILCFHAVGTQLLQLILLPHFNTLDSSTVLLGQFASIDERTISTSRLCTQEIH